MNTPHGTRNLVPEDMATILAALRFYQTSLMTREIPQEIIEIATNNWKFDRLCYEDIDDLCEEINCGLLVGIGE